MKENFENIDVEVNIYYTISIFDRDFYIDKCLDIEISYTIKSIIVYKIDKVRYLSLEYIRVNIFLVDKLKEKLSIIRVSWDIHLIIDLDLKILIKINILKSKDAIIDILAKRLRLKNNILYLLIIKLLKKRQKRLIYTFKYTLIKLFIIINISIRLRKTLLKNRNYLFKL